jgi:hypothetical protein
MMMVTCIVGYLLRVRSHGTRRHRPGPIGPAEAVGLDGDPVGQRWGAAGDVRGRLDRLDRRVRPAAAEGFAGGARATATSVGP